MSAPSVRLPTRPLTLPARLATSSTAIAAGLIALTAASGVLRTRAIDSSFWVDEGISVGIASHPLTAIPGLLREDGSPPLYYLLLHVWMGVAGRSEVATHVLSLLAALACVPMAWWMARTLWGLRAGWAAAVLFGVAPPLTEHAQETRMYPLVVLFALLVAGSFVGCFLTERPRMAWVHAVALVALAYTHDWFLFLAGAEAVAFAAVLAAAAGRRRELLRRAAVAFGVPLVLYLPWVPTLLFQARHTAAPWSREPGIAALWEARDWLLFAPAALTALTIAVAGAAIVLRRARPRSEWGHLAALAWMSGATLLLAWSYNQVNSAWASRYTTIVLGPLLLLCALAIARVGAAGLVALLVVAVAWAHEPPVSDLMHKSNVREMSARLARFVRPGDMVLSAAPESVPVLRYYLGPRLRYASSFGLTPDPGVMDWRDALTRLRHTPPRRVLALVDRLPGGSRVVLVRPRRHRSSPIAWQRLCLERGHRLFVLLRHDPLLRSVRTLSAGFRGTKTTTRASVFARVKAPAGTAGRPG